MTGARVMVSPAQLSQTTPVMDLAWALEQVTAPGPEALTAVLDGTAYVEG
jgi:hypothetical protein